METLVYWLKQNVMETDLYIRHLNIYVGLCVVTRFLFLVMKSLNDFLSHLSQDYTLFTYSVSLRNMLHYRSKGCFNCNALIDIIRTVIEECKKYPVGGFIHGLFLGDNQCLVSKFYPIIVKVVGFRTNRLTHYLINLQILPSLEPQCY